MNNLKSYRETMTKELKDVEFCSSCGAEVVKGVDSDRKTRFQKLMRDYKHAYDKGMTHKVWHTEGQNTRPSHKSANNQKVAIQHKFKIGGESLFLPSDPKASFAETANCKCTVSYISDESQCQKFADNIMAMNIIRWKNIEQRDELLQNFYTYTDNYFDDIPEQPVKFQPKEPWPGSNPETNQKPGLEINLDLFPTRTSDLIGRKNLIALLIQILGQQAAHSIQTHRRFEDYKRDPQVKRYLDDVEDCNNTIDYCEKEMRKSAARAKAQNCRNYIHSDHYNRPK